jgi:hypothetical protein
MRAGEAGRNKGKRMADPADRLGDRLDELKIDRSAPPAGAGALRLLQWVVSGLNAERREFQPVSSTSR